MALRNRQGEVQSLEEYPSPDGHRWSELIPPHAALTFAAILDPTDGLISFTAAELQENEAAQDAVAGVSPVDVFDNTPLTASSIDSDQYCPERASTISSFSHKELLPLFRSRIPIPLPERILLGHTQTSSTLGGLDVYLRGSILAKTHIHRREYSFLNAFGSDFAFDPSTPFERRLIESENLDQGSLQSHEPALTFYGVRDGINDNGVQLSRQSPETNAPSLSSDYIAINHDSDARSTAWSTIEPSDTSIAPIDNQRKSKTAPRRLKKQKRSESSMRSNKSDFHNLGGVSSQAPPGSSIYSSDSTRTKGFARLFECRKRDAEWDDTWMLVSVLPQAN